MTVAKLSHWEIAALIFDLYAARQGAVVADDATTAIVVEYMLDGALEQRCTVLGQLRSVALAVGRLFHHIPRDPPT